MALIKAFDLDQPGFEYCSSQQFATVMFDRGEDDEQCTITVMAKGLIRQFTGNNTYNPSHRRWGTAVYIYEEIDVTNIFKVVTYQHKGLTCVELHSVDDAELEYLGLLSITQSIAKAMAAPL